MNGGPNGTRRSRRRVIDDVSDQPAASPAAHDRPQSLRRLHRELHFDRDRGTRPPAHEVRAMPRDTAVACQADGGAGERAAFGTLEGAQLALAADLLPGLAQRDGDPRHRQVVAEGGGADRHRLELGTPGGPQSGPRERVQCGLAAQQGDGAHQARGLEAPQVCDDGAAAARGDRFELAARGGAAAGKPGKDRRGDGFGGGDGRLGGDVGDGHVCSFRSSRDGGCEPRRRRPTRAPRPRRCRARECGSRPGAW